MQPSGAQHVVAPALPAEIEFARLKILTDCDILDTAPEIAFDAAVEAASFLCQMPISLVSFVDDRRQWFKARVGLDITETPRASSFCTYSICCPNENFIVVDTFLDERFVKHPLVTGFPYVRFYAGFPIVTSTGHALGTLCVIDTQPRVLSPEHSTILLRLSQQISAVLDQRIHLREVQRKLLKQAEHHAELTRAMSDLERRNVELLAATLTDPLTGIGNRRGFDFALRREHERALRENQPLSIIMIDIDFFKSYNDDFGHLEGDLVLIEVAQILRSSLRAPEYLARYGGEEFVVILPASTIYASELAAERIRLAVESNPWPHRSITISLGVATTNDPVDRCELIKLADIALYQAKVSGRNRIKRIAVNNI